MRVGNGNGNGNSETKDSSVSSPIYRMTNLDLKLIITAFRVAKTESYAVSVFLNFYPLNGFISTGSKAAPPTTDSLSDGS